jgi:hypothetical protein
MHCLALAFAMAAVASCAAATNVTGGVTSHWFYEHASEGACAGPSRKNFTAYNACMAQPRTFDAGSIKFAPAVRAPAATVQLFTNGNCSGLGGAPTNVMCGQCLSDPNDQGYFHLYKCDVSAHVVSRQARCNADCSACAPVQDIEVPGCVVTATGSLKVVAALDATWTAGTLYAPADVTCSGRATSEWIQCDTCRDEGVAFDCN